MTRKMLEDYTRRLTTDTRGCAELFAPAAEFETWIGGHHVRLQGRQEIVEFLTHVPRQVTFRLARVLANGSDWEGRLDVTGADLAPSTQVVRYRLSGGLFKLFTIETLSLDPCSSAGPAPTA